MTNKILLFLAFISITLFSSCHSAQHISNGRWLSENEKVTNPTILILEIHDGQERNGEIATGTGKFVQSELRNQLLSRKIIAIPAETYDLKVGLDMAKNQNLTYVMKINIIEWENNATEWTGEPDVASVNADLYATKTGYLVATASQKEAGSQAAITSGKPDRFVPTMITGLLNTLFP